MTTLSLALNGPQTAIHRRLRPGATLCTPWGRGTGKSWWDLVALCLLVAQYDGVPRKGALGHLTGVRIVLMCPTFKQAKDLFADKLAAALEGDGEWAFLGARIDRTTWRIRFPGGSWIQLFGAENAHASRGLRADVVAVDEADDVDLEVFDAVIAPWFSEPWSLKIRMVSGTPRRGRYGLLYRTHQRGTPDPDGLREGSTLAHAADHYSVHATGYDTPETVDRAYLDKMRAETPPTTFAREYLCDFDSAAGLVYPHFDIEVHVAEPHPDTRWSEVIVGADFGFNHPGAFVVIGVAGSGRDVLLHVLDEVVQTQREDDWWVEQAQAIERTYPHARWYADPSRPGTISTLKQDASLNIRAADNAMEDGLAYVATALVIRETASGVRWSQLRVSPKCREVIREFGAYRRKRDPKTAQAVAAHEAALAPRRWTPPATRTTDP